MFTQIPTIHQNSVGFKILPKILLMHVHRLLFTKFKTSIISLSSCNVAVLNVMIFAGGFSQNCLRGRNHATESFGACRQ